MSVAVNSITTTAILRAGRRSLDEKRSVLIVTNQDGDLDFSYEKHDQ